MNNRLIRALGAVAVIAAALLVLFSAVSCGFLKPGPPADTAPVTGKDGKYPWPAGLLPADFPMLAARADYISLDDDKYDTVIGFSSPTWEEYRAFIAALTERGWGSIKDGYIRDYTEREPDAALGIAEGLTLLYENVSEREKHMMTYSGRRGDTEVFCYMDAAESKDALRCVVFVKTLPESDAYNTYSGSLGCTFDIRSDWTAADATDSGGLTYVRVRYSYDPDNTLISLSSLSAGSVTPAVLAAEYKAGIISSGYSGDMFRDFELAAGGDDTVSFAFTVETAGISYGCVYAAWTSPDGTVWQMTLSASDYNLTMATGVLRGMCASFSDASGR